MGSPSPTHDQPNPKTFSEEPKLDSSDTHFNSPPESFRVPKSDENDWLDQNAIMERKTSRKLGFFPAPTDHHHQTKPGSLSSVSSSTRKPKTSLIGFQTGLKSSLPNANQRRNKTRSMFLFRSRSEPGRKTNEPDSPQVNCVGRIGTRRKRPKKTGIWRGVVIMLRLRFKVKRMASTVCCNEVSTAIRTGPVEPVSRAPGLAGLKRLKSTKRSDTS